MEERFIWAYSLSGKSHCVGKTCSWYSSFHVLVDEEAESDQDM